MTFSPASRRRAASSTMHCGGIDLGLAVGQHRLHQLELGDRLAELLALASRSAARRRACAAATPTQTAAMWMRPLSSTFIAVLKPCPSLPPIRLAAGTRQFSKITSQVWAPRWPIFLSGLPRRDAGRLALDDEGRDAAGALLGRIGARHQREDAGLRRVGDEALGAVDDVVLAVAPMARGAQRGGVRAGVRLGQRERGDDLAGRQLRQVLGLLLLGAVDHDALRADADRGAEHRAEGRRGLAQLEHHQHLLFHRQSEAAIRLRGWSGRTGPSCFISLDDGRGNARRSRRLRSRPAPGARARSGARCRAAPQGCRGRGSWGGVLGCSGKQVSHRVGRRPLRSWPERHASWGRPCGLAPPRRLAAPASAQSPRS